jgi:16S rRNA (cytosine1402-N4)-methyltransferase
MLRQVLGLLDPRGDQLVVDCTVGLGGHAEAVLRRQGFTGRVVGIDRDPAALAAASERLRPFGHRFEPQQGRFGRAGELLEGMGCAVADAVLFDLGVSSMQLDEAGRGFSFRLKGPLDMRMDPRGGPSAADLVSQLDAAELERVLREYGEERRARRVAAAIVRERRSGPIASTVRLAEIVRGAVGRGSGRIDPATRSFQALRIAVNDELGELGRGLESAARALRPGGRLVAISYHSLEDRIVKRTLRRLAAEGGRLLTRKPLTPDEDEVRANPRARSAKLRALETGEGGGSAA